MKKLIFLIHFNNIKNSSGIIEKIFNQSKNMNKLNILYKTYILISKDDAKNIGVFPKVSYIEFVPVNFLADKRKHQFLKLLKCINRTYQEYVNICKKEINNYDMIYVRYNPLYPGFINFVKNFRKKIIFEHNSIEIEEYKSNKSKLKVIFSKMFDKKIKNLALGYVCVSSQIFNFQKKIYNKNISGILITNGIDVKKYKIKEVPKYDGKNINMIFVGNIRYWHGIERILEGIEKYNGKTNIIFNICGNINQEDYLKDIIKKMKKKDSIKMLGYETRENLNKYFDESHIAIGSLGCYKKNIEYASTLKNREYFARGIPIVFSEIDEDISIPENKNFYYKVSNDDGFVNMEKIIDFASGIYKNNPQNITKNIRKFAEENLDYGKKIEKLRDFINGI